MVYVRVAGSVVLGLLIVLSIVGTSTPAWAAGMVHTLTAGELRLLIENTGNGIRLVSLTDLGQSSQLTADTPLPLWEGVLIHSTTGEKVFLNAETNWKDVSVQETDSGLDLHWSTSEDARLEGISVVAYVSADPENNSLAWKMQVTNDSAEWCTYEVAFPQLAVAKPTAGRFFYPKLEGIDTAFPTYGFKYQHTYPDSYNNSMQYMAVYSPFQSGLYFGMHDPVPTVKHVQAKSLPGQALSLQYSHPVPDFTRPGNDFELSGEAVWQLFRGDWFDAAMIYRGWVRQYASWYPKMGPNGRLDTPQWFKEIPLWVKFDTPGRIGALGEIFTIPNELRHAQKLLEIMGTPVAFHWYGWMQIPFDNDYPHFHPALDGFKEGVQQIQEWGGRVIPYINTRLWDMRDDGLKVKDFLEEGLPAAMKRPDGTAYVVNSTAKEIDGSRVINGVMDPSVQSWQKKVQSNALRLFSDYGVDGVYLDQVGGPPYARPQGENNITTRNLGDPLNTCYDPSHDHLIGGGSWWIDGYNEMFAGIRAQMPDDGVIVSEHTPEMHASLLDAGLAFAWGMDNDVVPAFPAVYGGGAFQPYGRNYYAWHRRDTIPMERVMAAEQLVNGVQMGWFNAAAVMHADLMEYIATLAQLRYKLSPYFYAGEMERPLNLDVPNMTTKWGKKFNIPITKKSVLTSTWKRVGEEKHLFLFANTSEKAVTTEVSINFAEYGLASPAVKVQVINHDGLGEQLVLPQQVKNELTFPPLSAFAWEIGPADAQ